jgi:hypothetical protein
MKLLTTHGQDGKRDPILRSGKEVKCSKKYSKRWENEDSLKEVGL